MHGQVLVIHPSDVDLKDIMYFYQEVDKTPKDCLSDGRCQFMLGISEDEVSDSLKNIKEKLIEKKVEYADRLKYRANHSLEEFEEKYNIQFRDYMFSIYEDSINALEEYEYVKDLPVNHPRQIKFIKANGSWLLDKYTDIYIPGKGYGLPVNPYGIWDYYGLVDDFRFPKGTYFLKSKDDLIQSNEMDLQLLDVDVTVDNINEYTLVWDHIIFCKKEAADSKIYTTRSPFYEWADDCLVDNLKDKLQELYDDYSMGDYIVEALDFHY